MGENKNSRTLVYPTQKHIRENELTQVGFNALIPNVTIVLTENSMNFNVVQKIIDESRPNYYHKFVILNPYIYTKSYILKAILEFVQPFTIHPIYYNETRESVYFLAKNCLKAVMKIVSNKFRIPHSDKQFKLVIFVNCMFPEDVPVVDTFQNISEVLNKLYDPITGALNLSNFSNHPELINYYPLFDEKIFEKVMKQAALLKIKQIDLSKNCIKKLYGMELLKYTLEVLDISSNDLDVISCLLALKRFTKLKVLNLTENPLCENYNSLNYIKDVKRYCPNLQTLDGVNIIIPKFVKNFLCVPDAKYLAAQFLEHFFTTYDSPNRINLVHLYDVHAIFSVTANIIPNQSNSKNVKLGHYGIKNPYAVYGIGEIMKLFQEFPRSYHDPYPIVCDVTLYTDTNAQIIVTGIFREYTQILSFSRSFYFSRSDDHFRIVNEQLHISNALDFQMGWSFIFPVDFQYTGNPLPFFKDQFKHFEEAMQKLTNMNLEYCQKYLVYCNYDLKKALSLFSELHVNNDVPKEAFEIRKPNPSASPGADICENLKKKVLQSHGSISLKTIWTTLNRGRIENTYDPQITIDQSILRIYRKPNIPVCFEDYPVTLESTNLMQQDFRNSFQTSVSNEEKLRTSFKSFLEREIEANRKSKNVKPISLVLPQPHKPPVSAINPPKETVPIPKSSQSNPLLDLANKMARNKELVLNELKKSKQSKQSFSTSQHLSSEKPSTSSGRTLQPRPTAAAFFNTQPTFSNPQPGPSKYIPESIPRVAKPINIPISAKKNVMNTGAVNNLASTSTDKTQGNVPATKPLTTYTISKLRENLKVINTKAVNNLASTSTDKTQDNVPATNPLTTDTISKLRENLQKEKQRLQNLKTNLNTSNEKRVKKNKEDPQTIVSNTTEQTDKGKNNPHKLQSNVDPEKSKKLEQKEKNTINKKINNDENCPSKTILKSGKKSTSKDNESAKKISTDEERDTSKIIVNVESMEKNSDSKNEMTVENKQIDDNVSNPKNETKLEENKTNRKSVPSEMTEEKNNDKTIPSHENITTIEGNQMITVNIVSETTLDFEKTSLNEKITNDEEVTILIAEDKKVCDELLPGESSLSSEKENIEGEETTIDPKNVYVDNQNDPTDIIMEHTKEITEENQYVPCETISNIETKTTEKETSHQEICKKDTNVETEQQIVINEVVAITQIDNNVSEETAKSHPDLSRKLIVRLYKLSHAELEEMATCTPFYMETPSSDETDQKLEDIDLKFSTGKSTSIQDDENADEKLLDIMENKNPLVDPQNDVKLTFLKINDTKSKVDSHSDVNIRSWDDHNQIESQKNEQLHVDSEATEKMAVVKKDTFKTKNLVVRLTRIIASKGNPTSSEDNIKTVTRNIKKSIQQTNRQSNEVKSVKRKTDQEAAKLEPVKVKPKIENKQLISTDIKKEIQVTNRQSNQVGRGKRKTDQEATKLEPVKRKPKIEDKQIISKDIKKEIQVADSQRYKVNADDEKAETKQEVKKLEPVKRISEIEEEQLISKNINKEIQVADSQSNKVNVAEEKTEAKQEVKKLEPVRKKPKIEEEQFISKNINKEIQVADSQSNKVNVAEEKTEAEQEATELEPVKKKSKIEEEQLISKNINKEIQVADSQSNKVNVAEEKTEAEQEATELEHVKRKSKIEEEQLISKSINKEIQVADSQSNKVNVAEEKTESEQEATELEPVKRKSKIGEEQLISKNINKEIQVADSQCNKVNVAEEKTEAEQEETELEPVKRKSEIKEEQLISKNINKEIQVADSQSNKVNVAEEKTEAEQEATELEPVKKKSKIEEEQLISKNINKEIQVADGQSNKVNVAEEKTEAEQEATELEPVKRKSEIEEEQLISENIKKEIQVADSQSNKVNVVEEKTEAEQEATKLEPVNRKPKIEQEQLISRNIKKEIQVADSQGNKVNVAEEKTEAKQEVKKLESLKGKPKIEEEQLISKNIKKEIQIADSQSNKVNVAEEKTEAEQEVKKLEPVTRKQDVEKKDPKSTDIVLKLDEQDDEDDDDLYLSFWNMGSDDDD